MNKGINCSQFDEAWNEFLDRFSDSTALLDPEASEHAEACPRCRALSLGYRLLGEALRPRLNPRPRASLNLAAHVVHDLKVLRFRQRRASWIAAAAALITVSAALSFSLGRRLSERSTPLLSSGGVGEGVESSLFDAAAATVDLGKRATEKSQRLGVRIFQKLASDETGDSAVENTDAAGRLLQGPFSKVRGLIKTAASVDLAPFSRSADATLDAILPAASTPKSEGKTAEPRKGV